MDGQGQRGDIISQSGLSNSTESLDSMKALTAAIEAANAQIHGPASQHVGNSPATVTTTTTIATVTTEDRKKEHFKKNRCLSVGIQVTASLSVVCNRHPKLRHVTLPFFPKTLRSCHFGSHRYAQDQVVRFLTLDFLHC